MPQRAYLSIVVALLAMLAAANKAYADGGAVRLREQVGPYLVTAFTSPTPFRQGLVDISVLVQDAASSECISNVKVIVRLKQRGTQHHLVQQANSAAASNKLFQAALFELPAPGLWEVEVSIAELPPLHFTVEADHPAPRWQSLWPWYSWPALAIILFGCHQLLVLRKGR